MDFLDGLNESQRVAVENFEGPTMVIAGAGSGKTRVLTMRIAYMIQQGIDPFSILALTFTNKAAKEMKARISSVVGESEAKNISMGTFHSVFARILRANAHYLGYPQNFTIYDTQDTKSLLKDIIKELNLDDKIYKPSMIYGRISAAKNNLISADDYALNPDIVDEDKMSQRPDIARIYKAYSVRCFKAGAMDFDDLLFQTNILFRDFPNVLEYYQHKFKYILVDEYQDTNYSQYIIIKKLGAIYENVCVVGDDAQSIYSFRGANIQNIFNFRKDYPDFKLFKLEQNYRSTQTIVDAANSVISKNKDQIKKSVWTENDKGNQIVVVRTMTDNHEGKTIADKIFDIKHSESSNWTDFAVLYRTNRQSRAFEEALRKLNMPYKIYGGISFYQRKEIKDLLAYFRLTANHNDEEALKRVYNYPKRGIGKTSWENIIIASNQHNKTLWEIISNFDLYPVDINNGTKQKLTEFVTMIQSFHAELEKQNAYQLAQTIAKSSGILKELYSEKDKGPEEVERYQNIEELLAAIKDFTVQKGEDEVATLNEFMIDVALLTDADTEKEEDVNKISLMTIHSSKGLEFKHVFLVGLEENLFPSQLSINSREELEEERRLFYVALTRAEKSCTISYAASRFQWGNLISCEPSRFIDEISPEYLRMEQSKNQATGAGRSLSGRNAGFESKFEGGLNKGAGVSSRSLHSITDLQTKSGAGDATIDLKVGYNVIHERFGKGKVVKLEDSGVDRKATIFFPNSGTKVLLLKFAKLTVIED